jgi:hypothetical protein
MKYVIRTIAAASAIVALALAGAATAKAGVWLAGPAPAASPGRTATVAVWDLPAARCSISVVYKSGPSVAQGLYPKAPQLVPYNSRTWGFIRWSWFVGTRTTPGTWPITIYCGTAGSLRTSISVF